VAVPRSMSSSFKRKTPSSAAARAPALASTGVASLDDLLGGGLPFGCTLAALAPDPHAPHGALLARYALAQGLAAGHAVLVVDARPRAAVEACMWRAREDAPVRDEERDEDGDGEKIKIAWRYEGMRPFRTTVADARASVRAPAPRRAPQPTTPRRTSSARRST
jgi:elongator complex protein 4